MISKLQITRRPTTKPAMGASSSSWFLLRPMNTFSSFFFYRPLFYGPPSARFSLFFCRGFVSSSFSLVLSSPRVSRVSQARVFASVHQRSIHRNYNNNNDKSRNTTCAVSAGWGTAGRRGTVGRSSTCRPGAIVFFFVSDLSFWARSVVMPLFAESSTAD